LGPFGSGPIHHTKNSLKLRDKLTDNLGFDALWTYVPSFGTRQLALTIITGLISFQDGLLNMFPIFAVYTPKTYYCASDSRLTGFQETEFIVVCRGSWPIWTNNWVANPNLATKGNLG